MQWVITEDKISTDVGDSAVGQGNFKGDPKALPYEFRLLDGDNEVYYHGRSDERDSQAAFAPQDWAEGYAGCTAIEYLRAGRWEVL